MNSNSSDYEKLQLAFSDLRSKFQNVHCLVDALGLSSLPTAQLYGIYLGTLTFVVTCAVVVLLLICGGTFHRIQEQAEEKKHHNSSTTAPSEIREQRAFLFDQLLEQRQRMMLRYTCDRNKCSDTHNTDENRKNEDGNSKSNTDSPTIPDYGPTTVVTTMPTSEAAAPPPPPLAKETLTELTHMLLNVAPPTFGSNTTTSTATTKTTADSLYEQHYKHAYRRCQDRPGGTYLL
jgi:hypothetical protein